MRLGITARHVGELIEELRPLLAGLVVRDVEALPPRDLLLVLDSEAPGDGVRRLRLSADPVAPRIHLQTGRVRSHRGPVGPFFRAAAEELVGRRVAAVEQVAGDRIVRLVLAGDGERRLFAELVGRHANLVLADEEERVLAVLVPHAPGPPGAGRAPRLVIGQPWAAPPGRPAGSEGPPLSEAFDPPADAEPPAAAPLSWRVEEVLGRAAEERLASTARRDLVARVQRRVKSAKSRRRGLEERRRAADGAERVRMDGELLKAHQGELRRGLASVELADWFVDGSPPRRIELEPKLRPQENVERLFKRYKKLVRDRETLDAEEARTAEVLADLEALLEAARDEAQDPLALETQALERGLLKPRQERDPRKRAAPAPRLSYRRFRGSKGSEIRVGRSAADNDRLTLRESRGNDVWLHTRDAPGSHVVLRTERGREPDPDEVLDAAHLALHFSPLQGARKAAIHVARCKEVRKPKGAPPGLVQLSGGKTLQLRVEPERLKRLLDTRPGPERAAGEAR